MTVAQLIERLQQMPREAVVLLESEGGFARIAGRNREKSPAPSLPDEVVLVTAPRVAGAARPLTPLKTRASCPCPHVRGCGSDT